MKQRLLVRNAEAGQLLEAFFVSAVVSILGIRSFLALTNYPQLSGNGLHIAHMLWGGVLMLTSIVLLLNYLGHRLMVVAAVLGGLGFGAFIDELGKFITSDNNYFFKPTIAIIYLLFVGMYFLFQAITAKRGLSKQEYTLNALFKAEEIAHQDLDSVEKAKLLSFINRADQENVLVVALREAITKTRANKPGRPTLYGRLRHALLLQYRSIARLRWFVQSVTLLFMAQAAISTFYIADSIQDHSPLATTSVASSLISTLSILIGVFCIRSSKQQAYSWFRRSLIFDILVTQVFLFYNDQLGAVRGLALKLILLIGLQFMIDHQNSTNK